MGVLIAATLGFIYPVIIAPTLAPAKFKIIPEVGPLQSLKSFITLYTIMRYWNSCLNYFMALVCGYEVFLGYSNCSQLIFWHAQKNVRVQLWGSLFLLQLPGDDGSTTPHIIIESTAHTLEFHFKCVLKRLNRVSALRLSYTY